MKMKLKQTYIAVLLESGEGRDKRSTWLNLPVSKKRFAAALERIDAVNGNFIIADYTYRVPGATRKMTKGAPFAMVNFLAARLKTLTDEALLKLYAIWDTDYYFVTVGQLIDYTFNTHEYTILPGVRDAEALGVHYIGKPDNTVDKMKLGQFIDRYEYGAKLAAMENGVFTPHGYVTSRIGWDLPETERRVPEYLNIKGWLGEDLYADWESDYVA